MSKDNLEWGENHHGKEHSETYACVNDECPNYYRGYFDNAKPKREIVIGVGFDKGHSETGYTAICECPKCFTKYWFHIWDKEAIRLAEFHKSKLEDK
jgi:hypothetical protein